MDVPKGFTLDSDVPQGFKLDTPSSSSAPPTNLDPFISTAAKKYSLDAKVFRSLISDESSFNPKAKSSAGAIGLGQLMPGTAAEMGVKDPYDPVQNLDGSAKYLAQLLKRYNGDYMRAVAAYNAGPGNVDKHGVDALNKIPGADPDYLNKILGPLGMLNKPIVQPASAATSSPPPGFKQDTTPKPPAKTSKPMWEQIAAVPDAMFIAGNASLRGKNDDERRKSLIKALTLFVHSPADANEEYGFMSKGQLEYEKKNGGLMGSAAPAYFLNHPKQAGLVAGAAEFVNPGNELVGGAVSKGFSYVAKTPQGAKLLSFFHALASPLKGVMSTGGQEGKRAMQALLVKVAGAPAQAQSMALKVFSGLPKEAWDDVVHLYQGEYGAVKTTDPKLLQQLQQRADLLRDYTATLTHKQVAAKTLNPNTAAANPDHFGMKGAYHDDALTPQQQKVFEGGSMPGGAVTREGSEKTQAQFKTLHEGQTQAKVPLKDDFNVVNQTEKNFSHAIRNVEFEKAAQQIPDSLLLKNTPHNPLHPPKDGAGVDMVHFKDIQRKNPALAEFLEFSPSLKNAYISPALYHYLEKNATRLYDDRKFWEMQDNPVYRAAGKAYSNLNNSMRMAVIANPLFHPVWNLSNNALGAGLPVHQVAGLVTKSVVNSLGGGKLVDRFNRAVGYDYEKAVSEALSAGAIAEMRVGGADTTQRLASRWSDLSTPDKALKALDTVQAWNNRLTFGRHGEEAFSAALYQHLLKSGKYSKEEAAGLVREALGNYQNVSKDAWQNSVIFFYPWLKGNMPFWVRKSFQNPDAVEAPVQGVRRNNDIVADPSEQQRRANPLQFTEHNPQSYGRGTLPLPQRMAFDAFGMLGGDPNEMLKNSTKVVAGRAQPLPGAALDTIITGASQPKDPSQPQNYNIIFDKDAPRSEQLKQTAGYAANRVLPIPVAGFQVRDALREGKGLTPGDAVKAVTGINTYDEKTKPEARKEYRARRQFEIKVSQAKKIKDPERRDKKIKEAYAHYQDKVSKTKKSQPSQAAPPPGFTLDVPAGFTLDK